MNSDYPFDAWPKCLQNVSYQHHRMSPGLSKFILSINTDPQTPYMAYVWPQVFDDEELIGKICRILRFLIDHLWNYHGFSILQTIFSEKQVLRSLATMWWLPLLYWTISCWGFNHRCKPFKRSFLPLFILTTNILWYIIFNSRILWYQHPRWPIDINR